MVTYSKYGRQASSKEVGARRIAIHDGERTANPSYIVKNNFGFSINTFNKGIALYKNMYLGICSPLEVSRYIDAALDSEVNFNKDDLDTGMAFAKRYIDINNSIEGLEYKGKFDENVFLNEVSQYSTLIEKGGRNNGK